MTVLLARGCGAALIYTFAAQAAFADLTAQDVWSDWRNQLTSFGYEVTGTESTSGDTLTVRDASFSTVLPENGGEVAFGMGQLQFQENADGTVTVVLADRMPFTFDGIGSDNEKISVVAEYTQSGSSFVASGSPDDFVYDFSAASAGVSLTSVVIDGEPMPPSVVRAAVTMTNLKSNTQTKIAQLRNQIQAASVGSVNFDFAFADPDSDDSGEFSGAMQNLQFQGTGQMPQEMDPGDFATSLQNGLKYDGTFTYAAGSSDGKGQGDGETFTWQTASQGGSVKAAIGADAIAYDVVQNDAGVTFTSGQLPFPVELKAAKSAFKIELPVSKSDAEQDFALGMTLGDFTVSDMVWSMFDPSAVMPRDPATIDLDVTGKARVLVDFMDPEVAETLDTSDQDPAELNALTINRLLISMVGAQLSGTGDFTFDNTDKTTFDGMPKPTGFVDLVLVGGNGLLDRLIQMGFVSDQDAMGARMMMGLLAVPGDGDDTLKSKLEINDQGHIMANGQRIQ